jgi:hypothetical protein
VKDFWSNFNFEKVIENSGDAWIEMLQSCMNGVWRNILPDVVTDFMALILKRRLEIRVIALLTWPGLLDLRM